MKVGDVLIYLGGKFSGDIQPYTYGNHYIIYKIDEHDGWRTGNIRDNYGDSCYFKESEATDKNWRYLKDIRKEKIIQLNKICT
jgi:hypothetical protein